MKRIICFILMTGWVAVASAQNQSSRPNAGDRLFPALTRVLTDAQRESLRTTLESQSAQIQSLERTMRTSRQALLDEITGGNFDEAAARQNAQASASAEADLTVIYAKALSQMNPPLSAEQIGQIKSFSPGQSRRGADAGDSAPGQHLPLPAPLPQDSNGLPVVN
jgi:Spy/CpxP family protein refolding chaperone